MSNPFKTPEFKTLFQEWNTRLEAEGLCEIEDFSLPAPALKSWHNFRFGDRQKIEDTQRYYDLAREMLHWFLFKRPRHRVIWELHCEGLSVRQISVRIHHSKSNVNDIIRRIEMESGIRNG